MTVKEHFEPYFMQIANLLALKDWQFEYDDSEAGEDASAHISCIFGRKLARIGLAQDFLSWPLERQRHTIVHEVLHAHFAMLWEFGCNSIDSKTKIIFQMLMEYAVDGLADAIAPLMPLPEPYNASQLSQAITQSDSIA